MKFIRRESVTMISSHLSHRIERTGIVPSLEFKLGHLRGDLGAW